MDPDNSSKENPVAELLKTSESTAEAVEAEVSQEKDNQRKPTELPTKNENSEEKPNQNLASKNERSTSNLENKNSKKVVKIPEFQDGYYTEEDRPELREIELEANVFSRFYDKKEETEKTENDAPPPSTDEKQELAQKDCTEEENLRHIKPATQTPKRSKTSRISKRKLRSEPSEVQSKLERYTHSDAIDFAVESRIWSHLGKSTHPPMGFTDSWRNFFPNNGEGVKAYYRFIADQGHKYILLACHVNVHGLHRGDLRFVEVNDQTIVQGFEGDSIIGKMFLGDIVEVTELRKTSNLPLKPPKVSEVNPDSKCSWAVHTMSIMPRNASEQVLFMYLPNGLAVVKGFGDAVVVKSENSRVQFDKVFTGRMFFPEKIGCVLPAASDQMSSLCAEASKIPTYANAVNVIHTVSQAPTETAMLETGVNAYNQTMYKPDEIVELCVRFGCSAVNAISNERRDNREFEMLNPEKYANKVSFCIPNSYERPTENLWLMNTRIEIRRDQREDDEMYPVASGSIETVTADSSKRQLRISARFPNFLLDKFNFAHDVVRVSQTEGKESLALEEGFFTRLPDDSNGKRIIKTLYGGEPFTIDDAVEEESFVFQDAPAIPLNKYQNEYVSMLCSRKTPLVVACAPFGCGKSMTIVTAALEMLKPMHSSRFWKKQLLVTQSNHASVNLVEIAKKCAKNAEHARFLRFVSNANWKELADHCKTEYDLPKLMNEFCRDFVLTKLPVMQDLELNEIFVSIFKYAICEKIVQPDELKGRSESLYNELMRRKDMGSYVYKDVRNAFFHNYSPNIFLTTADSLQGLIAAQVVQSFDSVQIDEASQVPEYTLLNLFSTFPAAHFGLIGDIQQLPPYCEDDLRGKLKEYGIGNTMERAVRGKLFPQATLKYVYRCHPVTTQILSDLFYDKELISGVTAEQKNAFMKNRSDIWPNVDYSMIVVDNKEPAYRVGTSCANKAEVTIAKQIVDSILKPDPPRLPLDPKDVGVISFYSAQTSALARAFRGTDVKCGTVDSFQGSEREVVVLCCTNENPSSFMQLSNRLNVAMSRAKQATIIIGNVDGLRRAKYWWKIVQRAEEHGCLVDTTKYPFKVAQKRAEEPKSARQPIIDRKRARTSGMPEEIRRKMPRLNGTNRKTAPKRNAPVWRKRRV